MPALREGRAQWVLKTSSSPLAEPSSAREADRLLPEGHQAVTTPATQYAVLQGFLTGATGLEPATSGVTGLFHKYDDWRRLTRYRSIHAGLAAFHADLCTVAQS